VGPHGVCVVAKAGGNRTGTPCREEGFVHRSLISDRLLIFLGNSSDAGRFLLIGSLPGQAFGDLFEVPPEVCVQCFLGLDRGHFSYLRFFLELWTSEVLNLLCAYLRRLSGVAFAESFPRKNR
jgi:hypothetical protein